MKVLTTPAFGAVHLGTSLDASVLAAAAPSRPWPLRFFTSAPAPPHPRLADVLRLPGQLLLADSLGYVLAEHAGLRDPLQRRPDHPVDRHHRLHDLRAGLDQDHGDVRDRLRERVPVLVDVLE